MMMIDTSKAICLASAIAMGLAATGVAVSSNLNASEIQVGRYSLLSAEPTEGQTDLLAPTVTVRFPAQIQTVGDSIRHLLRRSGYRLADAVALAPETIDLFALPLPAVHRQLGPMSLRRALEILAGPTPSVSCKILCIDSSHSNPVRRTGAVLATQAPARSARQGFCRCKVRHRRCARTAQCRNQRRTSGNRWPSTSPMRLPAITRQSWQP